MLVRKSENRDDLCYYDKNILIDNLIHFFPMFSFDLLTENKKPGVFWCFQGYKKGTLEKMD